MKGILKHIVVWGAFVVVLSAIMALIYGTSFPWMCALMSAILAGSLLTGAAAGAGASRSPESRALRLHRSELAMRGAARGGMLVGLAISMLVRDAQHGSVGTLLLGLGLGIVTGLVGPKLFPVVGSAERLYARALIRLKDGDADGARDAIREYIAEAEDDPRHEAHLPAAERFLAGETDTLVVATELESASAPAGRGTEVTAAEAPSGRGTELVGDVDALPEATADRAALDHREHTRG